MNMVTYASNVIYSLSSNLIKQSITSAGNLLYSSFSVSLIIVIPIWLIICQQICSNHKSNDSIEEDKLEEEDNESDDDSDNDIIKIIHVEEEFDKIFSETKFPTESERAKIHSKYDITLKECEKMFKYMYIHSAENIKKNPNINPKTIFGTYTEEEKDHILKMIEKNLCGKKIKRMCDELEVYEEDKTIIRKHLSKFLRHLYFHLKKHDISVFTEDLVKTDCETIMKKRKSFLLDIVFKTLTPVIKSYYEPHPNQKMATAQELKEYKNKILLCRLQACHSIPTTLIEKYHMQSSKILAPMREEMLNDGKYLLTEDEYKRFMYMEQEMELLRTKMTERLIEIL